VLETELSCTGRERALVLRDVRLHLRTESLCVPIEAVTLAGQQLGCTRRRRELVCTD
jgi:hypothetical protein